MIHQNQTGARTATSRVISISPVILPMPGRVVDIQMRISAPATGEKLPIILLSHGHGVSNNLSSLNGNLPLLDYWAAQGFTVIQPTHLDSKTLALGSEVSGFPLFWRSRVEDMRFIIDQLEVIEASVPEISGRLDFSRIAVAGLSLGSHTASMLLGAQLIDPENGKIINFDPRVKAGVLLSAVGNGGTDLSDFAAKNFSFFSSISFTEMTTQALVVAGDNDVSPHLTVRGADWHADPYFMSPEPKALLTVFGGEHLLGGLSGYDAAETTDENPERVAFVQKFTSAYLRSALYPGDDSWQLICEALKEQIKPSGEIKSK